MKKMVLLAALVAGCMTRSAAEERARSWARKLSDVTDVSCTGNVSPYECTVFRRDRDPIPLKCDLDGCHISVGRE